MKHKAKEPIIALCLLVGCATQSRALDVCGLVSNATWEVAQSPISVICDLNVAALTINPGVEVRFAGNYQITVNGVIRANGMEAAPIVFKPAEGNAAGWGKIYFEDAIPGSYFTWSVFEGATRSAVHAVRTTVPFSHCTFRNNGTTEYGGAVRAEIAGDDLVMNHCLFEGNHADWDGGAIYAVGPTAGGDPALVIADSLFISNNAGRFNSNRSTRGGAIYVQGNSRIQRTTFRGNEVRAYTIYAAYGVYALGGALFTAAGNSDITGSTFRDNRSNMSCHSQTPDISYPLGGAIYQDSGSTLLTNDLLVENWLKGCRNWYPYGSALFLKSGTCSVVNTTFGRNTIQPAIQNNSGTITVLNSILFWNNGSSDQVSGPATITYSDVQRGFDGEGNIDYDPIFDADYRIVPPSSAIDGGNPDPQYNDASRPPGLGGPRNDMGFTGGAGNSDWLATATATQTPSPTPTPTRLPCKGDINGDGVVTIDEILQAVNSALNGCP